MANRALDLVNRFPDRTVHISDKSIVVTPCQVDVMLRNLADISEPGDNITIFTSDVMAHDEQTRHRQRAVNFDCYIRGKRKVGEYVLGTHGCSLQYVHDL